MGYLFSVVIPTLNEASFLPNLLKDLEKQTEQSFETIICDGISDDETVAIAKRFQKKLRMKILFSKRRNVAHQKNLGGAQAKGEYIVFLDADVKLHTSFLQKVKKTLAKKRHLALIPAVLPQSTMYTDKLSFSIANAFIELSQNLNKPIPTPGCLICQTNLFNHMGGYQESTVQDKKRLFPEDHEILVHLKDIGVQAHFMKQTPIYFSMRRMEHEGRIETFFKYVLSSVQVLINTNTDGGLFKYEMGGHIYNLDTKDDKQSLMSIIKKYSKQLKDLVEEKD